MTVQDTSYNGETSTPHASSLSDSLRDYFLEWLLAGNAEKYVSATLVKCLDKMSAYALRKNISSKDLWHIAQYNTFKSIYDKMAGNKLFRIINRNTYKVFIVAGHLYLKYLQEKQVLQEAVPGPSRTDSHSGSSLTIKEAVIHVLKTEQKGMTVGQIYNKIVSDGLYCFGAQNPQNVIQVEIERACQYSNFTTRISEAHFKYNRNQEGKKVYYLLSPAPCLNHDKLEAAATQNKSTESVTSRGSSPKVSFQYVDLSHPELCSHTRPVACTINGRAIIPEKWNWSRLLLAITEHFIAEKNPNLAVLENEPIYGNKVFFLSEKTRFYSSSLLSNGKWITTYHSSQTIVTIIANLCRHCGVPLDDVVIKYLPVDERFWGEKGENRTPTLTKSKSIVSDKSNKSKAIVAGIIEEHFPNGIRPHSMIDTNRLRKFYRKTTGEEISADIAVHLLLNTTGIRHGEKVYVVSSGTKETIIKLLDRLITEGSRLFFYNELYDAYVDVLMGLNIFSTELLKTLISDIFPTLYYYRDFFGLTRKETVESEVLRCYESDICFSYKQLKNKLPYVPIGKIKQVLAQNNEFVWVNTGVYTHLSKINIDGDDRDSIKDLVKARIAEHGYTSLPSIDISASVELNPYLSEIAIRNGLFQMCLSDRYEKRGNIVARKGAALNSTAILKNFCLAHDRLSLAELLEFEKEISGRVCNRALLIACNTMVRVDKNNFVGDSEINFEVEATDNALALFVQADVIPLRAVSSFTVFPYVDGYLWNLYLLESYCRRFSKQFRFQCQWVNSKNVGAIFRRAAAFTNYLDVLATAVAASEIELSERTVGNYLFEKGYVAARTVNTIIKVITNAQILRERKV